MVVLQSGSILSLVPSGRPRGRRERKGPPAFKFRDRRVAYIFCSLTSPNTRRTYFAVLLNFTSLLKGPSFNRHRLTSIDRSSALSANHLPPLSYHIRGSFDGGVRIYFFPQDRDRDREKSRSRSRSRKIEIEIERDRERSRKIEIEIERDRNRNRD